MRLSEGIERMNYRVGLENAVIAIVICMLCLSSGCTRSTNGSNPSTDPNPSIFTGTGALSVSAVSGDNKVTLSWQPILFATSYNIYRSITTGVSITNERIAQISAPATTYEDLAAANGTTYYYYVTSITPSGEKNIAPEISATPQTGVATTVSVNGKVVYEDREYGAGGFTGLTMVKAVRFAAVDIVDSSGVIASGVSTSTGAYTVTFTPRGAAVYVRVNSAATVASGAPQLEVRSISPAALYGVPTHEFDATGDTTMNISIPLANVADGAFNILDVYVSAFQFVYSLQGTYPPGGLTAYWQNGNSNGTFFCTDGPSCFQGAPGAGIYVLNYGGDTDEFDDDVLWHEFGHFAAWKYSRDDSPGGMHYLTSTDLDLRLSWSEGWGDFFPTAIKQWLASDPSTMALLSTTASSPKSEYIDTTGNVAGIHIDINNPVDHGTADPFFYASSEIAVAKVLWNLMAGTGNFGMDALWSIVTADSFKNVSSPHPENPAQVNLETFWDGWLLRQTFSSEMLVVQSAFHERKIDYFVDAYESQGDGLPDSLRLYTPGQPETHTLYPKNDVDFVAFNVSTVPAWYTISTDTLLNGADTAIELYDKNAITLITGNDNADGYAYGPFQLYTVPGLCDPPNSGGVCHDNGYDVLGSQIRHQFTVAGTYYVKISSSPARAYSAGKYGAYTLTITSP